MAGADLHTSAEILASEMGADAGADPTLEIVSLDGEEQAALDFEIAETEASMEAAVAAIEAAGTDSARSLSPAAPTAGPTDAVGECSRPMAVRPARSGQPPVCGRRSCASRASRRGRASPQPDRDLRAAR